MSNSFAKQTTIGSHANSLSLTSKRKLWIIIVMQLIAAQLCLGYTIIPGTHPGYGNFWDIMLTIHCVYGPEATLADWSDIGQAYGDDVEAFTAQAGLDIGDGAWCTYEGSRYIGGLFGGYPNHYMIQRCQNDPSKLCLTTGDLRYNTAHILVNNIGSPEDTPPIITCPGYITIECGDSIDPTDTGYPTKSDNCGNPFIRYDDYGGSADVPSLITRVWTATDFVGNKSSCSQTIIVLSPDGDDRDGDGFTEDQGDCCDTDPRVNPDATEVIDGLDNDCDGNVDNVSPPPSDPPVASFTISPETPMIGEVITLDASGSTGQIVQYDWVLEDPWNTAQGNPITFDADEEGRFTIALTVTDNIGRTSAVSKVVYVSGPLPNGLDTQVLQEGDLLFRRADEDCIYGWWSHVGMYIGKGLIIDSVTENGVQIRDIEGSFGTVSIWAVGRAFSPWQAAFALEYVRGKVGTKYGYQNLLQSWLFPDVDLRADVVNGVYCSQLVWLSGMEAGVDLDSNTNPICQWVLPDEIIFDDNVTIIDESQRISPNQRPTVIRIESPADLLLVDPLGRTTGTDPETGVTLKNIPNVFYYGADGQIGPEYISVEDLDGSWTLEVWGTGSGAFTVVTENIQKGNYLTSSVMGTAFPGSLTTYIVRNPKEGVSLSQLIEIDIMPGSNQNPINPGSNGLVPAAILSSETFDATQVDPTSVVLDSATVAVRGKGKSMAHEEDVNGDGLTDLVVQVETQSFADLGDGGTVELTGTTFDGQAIIGYDNIVVVPVK